jgi:hypothetical protein
MGRLKPISALPFAFWGVLRAIQLALFGWGQGPDPNLYAWYVGLWKHGGVFPYLDYALEYPPGALLFFRLPTILGDAPIADAPEVYGSLFGVQMLLVDLGCLALIHLGYRASGDRARVASYVYSLLTALMFPVLFTRFDLVTSLFVLIACISLLRYRSGFSAGLAIGLAGAIKLWPFGLVPIFAGYCLFALSRRAAMRYVVGIALAGLLPFLFFAVRAHWGVLDFLTYHSDRGIQFASFWATLALAGEYSGLTDIGLVSNYGSWHLSGGWADVMSALSPLVLVVLGLVPQGLVLFRRRLRTDPDTFLLAVFASVVGIMVGSNVYSAQFVLWIIPCGMLCFRQWRSPALLLALIAGTTTLFFPYSRAWGWPPTLMPGLQAYAPHPALLVAGIRNLCTGLLYVLLLIRIVRQCREGEDSRSPA